MLRSRVTIGTSIELNGGAIRDCMGLFCALGLPETATVAAPVESLPAARPLNSIAQENRDVRRSPLLREKLFRKSFSSGF